MIGIYRLDLTQIGYCLFACLFMIRSMVNSYDYEYRKHPLLVANYHIFQLLSLHITHPTLMSPQKFLRCVYAKTI